MKIENKNDLSNFIESHLKELGGESYGLDYVSEKLWEWHMTKMIHAFTIDEKEWERIQELENKTKEHAK